jgi:CRISPR-associated protein Cas5h
MDSVLVFDIFGDYAQFKKFFTNMSPLTFDLPSRTALMGIIGAIGGIPKEENPEFFSKANCFISLKILNKINKTKIPINYLKTISKTEISRFKNHKPTNVEFLKNPQYRIYFYHQNSVFFNSFCSSVQKHKSVYTPSFGIANLLMNFRYVGSWQISSVISQEFLEINSVALEEDVLNINFQTDVKIRRATLPLEMQNDREVIKYGNVFYEPSGKAMLLQTKKCYLVKENKEYICEF